jgi:hypothetical protein
MESVSRPTIQEIYDKMVPIVNTSYTLPVTTNKGLPGVFLEKLLGIPQSSACLDCADGELKMFPVKRLKNGGIVPKETIAVTMLSTDDLRNNDFKGSKCCKKMGRMLLVPYERIGDDIKCMAPIIIDLSDPNYADLFKALEEDYEAIRAQFLETGLLESKTGKILQNRTKGPGHGSISRAFYLRPEFAKKYVPM